MGLYLDSRYSELLQKGKRHVTFPVYDVIFVPGNRFSVVINIPTRLGSFTDCWWLANGNS